MEEEKLAFNTVEQANRRSPSELPKGFATRAEQIENKDGFYITMNLFGAQAGSGTSYEVIFTARHACEVLWVAETHRNPAGAACTLNLEILASGEALDAGDTVLATAFDLQSAADTPVEKTGNDLTATRQLRTGDRLAMKDTGTVTDVRGLSLTVYLKPLGKGHYR